MKIATPFYRRVPKDIVGNLQYRRRILQAVNDDPSLAAKFWAACAADPLFYINAFCWTYDPRREENGEVFAKLPMITYGFQDEGILEMFKAIGSHDILVEKSRDMGASWICILVFEWLWHFRPLQSLLMVSRTEDYVDRSDNPKSLMWKVDFVHQNLPPWLMPPGYSRKHHRTNLHIGNPHNGSVIDGESTTKQVARGDRRTAILLDEFAAVEQGRGVLSSTRDATNCRIFNSTPAGTGNAYYEIAQTDIKKLRFHWSEHPIKRRGLYTSTPDGQLKVLDPDGYPADYKPILDGKLRSPWYDDQCKRTASAKEIAQELDIDYLGSGWQFFLSDSINEAIAKHARPPIIVGDLEYDGITADPIRFREDERGFLSIWTLLDGDNKFHSHHRLVMSVDVSAGTGASNSTIMVYDAVTKEKLIEFASPYIRPEELARQAVALARWVGNPFMIWENNGPGRQFGDRVIELGYSNIYYRKNDESITKKVTDIPGWASTKETKLVLLGNYRSAIENGSCVNRSKPALEECLEYIFNPQGGVSHAREDDKDDPTGAKSNHGDRVIADALGWKGIKEWAVCRPRGDNPETPHGSLAWRRKLHEDAMREVAKDELGANWK